MHGRTIFLGDSAHQVSPFGARGGNGGVQDADNLAWKLAAMLNGEADQRLIDTYDTERIAAADENILHSTRADRFHHAEVGRRPGLPRRSPAVGGTLCVRPTAGELRAGCRVPPSSRSNRSATPGPAACRRAPRPSTLRWVAATS